MKKLIPKFRRLKGQGYGVKVEERWIKKSGKLPVNWDSNLLTAIIGFFKRLFKRKL